MKHACVTFEVFEVVVPRFFATHAHTPRVIDIDGRLLDDYHHSNGDKKVLPTFRFLPLVSKGNALHTARTLCTCGDR